MGVADYDITVEGELASEYATAFTPYGVQSSAGRSTIHATRLDQAALLALLAKAGDLALSVVRVERLDSEPPGRGEAS